jgi:hypothetical protein
MALGSKLLLGALAAGTALLFSCASPPETLKPWDQAAATGLSEDVAAATDNFYTVVFKDPEGGVVGSGDAQATDALEGSARTLSELAEGLSGHLRAGDGQPQTLDLFRDVKEKADDCAEAARSAFLPAPAQEAWNQVSSKIDALAQYYDTRGLEDLQDRP